MLKESVERVSVDAKEDEARKRTPVDEGFFEESKLDISVDHQEGESEPPIKKSKFQDKTPSSEAGKVSSSPERSSGKGSHHERVENNNFTIIKDVEPKKGRKVSIIFIFEDEGRNNEVDLCSIFFHQVKRILPSWLANPSVVSVDLRNLNVTITDISGLDESIIAQLKRNKVTHFFPGTNG